MLDGISHIIKCLGTAIQYFSEPSLRIRAVT